MNTIKIGFDIGGVISKYPEEMKLLMAALGSYDPNQQSYGYGVFPGYGLFPGYDPAMHQSVVITTPTHPFEIFIITDMPRDQAEDMLRSNGIPYDASRLLCGDWAKNGDNCKQVLMTEHNIDIMIDDRLDYITNGPRIGLFVMPRPDKGYYALQWAVPDAKQQRLEQLAAELGYELKRKDPAMLSCSVLSAWEALPEDVKKTIREALACAPEHYQFVAAGDLIIERVGESRCIKDMFNRLAIDAFCPSCKQMTTYEIAKRMNEMAELKDHE